jgi:hypothetical protein
VPGPSGVRRQPVIAAIRPWPAHLWPCRGAPTAADADLSLRVGRVVTGSVSATRKREIAVCGCSGASFSLAYRLQQVQRAPGAGLGSAVARWVVVPEPGADAPVSVAGARLVLLLRQLQLVFRHGIESVAEVSFSQVTGSSNGSKAWLTYR